MKLTIFLMTLLLSNFVNAGWTSGGGGFIRDSQNPWFLKNVKVVNYCVKINERDFGISQSLAEERIAQAIAYWKKEFDISRSLISDPEDPGIATQKFELSSCSPTTDLQFLLGVLPEEEAPNEWNPTSFIGIAMRTDYNRVTMRGKGFIYVSPGKGEYKYKNKNLVDDAWSKANGHLFRAIVMHELGHVFGVPHETGGQDSNLMHQSFPENKLQKNIWENPERSKHSDIFYEKFNPAMFKFRPLNTDLSVMMCFSAPGTPQTSQIPDSKSLFVWQNSKIEFSGDSAKFFGLQPNKNGLVCIGKEIMNDQRQLKIYGIDENNKSILRGNADLTWSGRLNYEARVMMWLPEEQEVFKVVPMYDQFYKTGYSQPKMNFKGIYKSTDGKFTREIFGSTQINGFLEVGGADNTKFYISL